MPGVRAIDLTRREFCAATLSACFLPVAGTFAAPFAAPLGKALRAQSPDDVLIVEFSDAGVRTGAARLPKVVKRDSEWRTMLSPLAYSVARLADTERAFSGAYWNLHDAGIFRCVCCGTALFSSAHKFDSGTGWPSFWQPIAPENVQGPKAQHPGADNTEVTCRRCDAHLGDIFDDGPRPTGLRYCIDSDSLRFVKRA